MKKKQRENYEIISHITHVTSLWTCSKNQGCQNTNEDDTFHLHKLPTYLDNGQLDIERILISHHVRARVQLLLCLGQPVHTGLVAV